MGKHKLGKTIIIVAILAFLLIVLWNVKSKKNMDEIIADCETEITEQIYAVISEAEKVRYEISNYELEVVSIEENRADCIFLADWKSIREPEDDPFIQGMKQRAETLSDEQEKAYADEIIRGWIVEMQGWPQSERLETLITIISHDIGAWNLYYAHVENGEETLFLLDEYAIDNWTEDAEARKQSGVDTMNEAISGFRNNK